MNNKVVFNATSILLHTTIIKWFLEEDYYKDDIVQVLKILVNDWKINILESREKRKRDLFGLDRF